MTSSRRKYHEDVRWNDCLETIRHYEKETGCSIRVRLRPSTPLQNAIIIEVTYVDIMLEVGEATVWEYREPWIPRLKPNLEPIVMRMVVDSFAALHAQPWSWTLKMRRMAKSE